MNTTVKEILLFLAILLPIIGIVAGGILYTDGAFDGTFMEDLFPALFFGFFTGYGMLLIVSNLFRNYPVVWVISGLAAWIVTAILHLCIHDGGYYAIAIVGGIACLMAWLRPSNKK